MLRHLLQLRPRRSPGGAAGAGRPAGRGLRVFQDEQDITDGESITRRIVDGLGRARMLVAWYSATYPTRRACQWELTAAIVTAGQDRAGLPGLDRRILVLNPEPGADHIQPLQILDKRFIDARGVDPGDLARRVAARLDGLAGGFG